MRLSVFKMGSCLSQWFPNSVCMPILLGKAFSMNGVLIHLKCFFVNFEIIFVCEFASTEKIY